MTLPAATDALAGWRLLLDALGEPAWLVEGASLRVLAANDQALALLGLDAAAVLGQDAECLIATPEDMAFWDEARQVAATGRGDAGTLVSDTALVDATGRLVQVTRQIRPVGQAARGLPPQAWLVRVRDRSAAQAEADERELLVAELQATLESTGDGILVTDLAGRIRAFNRRFAQIWGLPERLLTERQDDAVWDWMRRSVVDPDAYVRRLAQINEATLLQASERITLHSGQVLERVTQPQNSRGRPCGRVWSFRDHTELVQASERIEALTSTDTLTGLFNRRQMGEVLAEAIRQARRGGGGLALLLLDLDRFKQINDSLGHAVGDQVLLDCADRLKGCLRQGDVVARRPQGPWEPARGARRWS